MIKVHIWVDGEEVEPCDFPEVPMPGDIIKDPGNADRTNEFYRVVSRQWDVLVRHPARIHIHVEPADQF